MGEGDAMRLCGRLRDGDGRVYLLQLLSRVSIGELGHLDDVLHAQSLVDVEPTSARDGLLSQDGGDDTGPALGCCFDYAILRGEERKQSRALQRCET
jgi:hypothetical protein